MSGVKCHSDRPPPFPSGPDATSDVKPDCNRHFTTAPSIPAPATGGRVTRLFMMSGYHDNPAASLSGQAISSTKSEPAVNAPPYLPPPTPALQSPYANPHHGPEQSQSPAYAAGAHGSLAIALQDPLPHGILNPAQHQQQQQQHHQPQPPHIGPQEVQYSSVEKHGSSASPRSQQASTPGGSGTAYSKKNTRIPRACDLCSTRKVKVRSFSACPFSSLEPLVYHLAGHGICAQANIFVLPVRRRASSMRALPGAERLMHLRTCEETKRTSEQSRTSGKRGREKTKARVRWSKRHRNPNPSERSPGTSLIGRIGYTDSYGC